LKKHKKTPETRRKIRERR